MCRSGVVVACLALWICSSQAFAGLDAQAVNDALLFSPCNAAAFATFITKLDPLLIKAH